MAGGHLPGPVYLWVVGGAPPQGRIAATLRAVGLFDSVPWDMSSGPETLLVGRIVTALHGRWPRAWVVKIHGSSYQAAGIPDLLVVLNGLYVGLEVKAQRRGESEAHARGRATDLQLATIAAIRRAGGTAEVVLTVEEAVGVIETALRGTLT